MSDLNTFGRHSTRQGFTLVEMAIVLFVVALLLGGLLPTLSGQVEQQRRNDTRKQMDEIQQALIGFVISKGRLPCAADGTIATVPGVQNGAGQENCAAAVTKGVLPWATLGVNETDSWGWRYTYQVTANWADNIDGTGASCNVTTGVSFQLCSTPTLNVLATVGGLNLTPQSVPVVIVSHGKNGYGAYTPNGGSRLATGPDADETDNSNGNVNFVSKQMTPTFDDLVVWISPNVLFNRMVAAGKLP
ncbi:MAG: prepilin-type N-terminal cleavage/methylation domain-containing protein [Gallionella sp.]|nr:prepilin-type N-terminal cleavage/methylation domain-containing protein [Gallionella sp.]